MRFSVADDLNRPSLSLSDSSSDQRSTDGLRSKLSSSSASNSSKISSSFGSDFDAGSDSGSLSGFSLMTRPGSGLIGFSNLRRRASRTGSRGSRGFGGERGGSLMGAPLRGWRL